jgi:ribosome maturation factor RimP
VGAAAERGTVEQLVRPVVEAAGLELWDVSFEKEAGRMVLRVVVDRDGGVDLDTISSTSERVSRRLDLEAFSEDRPYSLEVSSPGLERPLREPRHFERSVGQSVKVRTAAPVDGRRTHEGALVSADSEAIVIASDGGELRVPYVDISSARTVFDWSPAVTKGRAKRSGT